MFQRRSKNMMTLNDTQNPGIEFFSNANFDLLHGTNKKHVLVFATPHQLRVKIYDVREVLSIHEKIVYRSNSANNLFTKENYNPFGRFLTDIFGLMPKMKPDKIAEKEFKIWEVERQNGNRQGRIRIQEFN